jgi:hypothetical protein
MNLLRAPLLACAALLALSTAATAQEEDEPVADDAKTDAAPGEAVPPEDAPLDERALEGVDENPEAPTLATDREAEWTAARAAEVAATAGYPRRQIDRPLALAAGMARVALDVSLGGQSDKIAYQLPGNDAWFRLGGVLGVEYGITNRYQVGLRYGVGTLHDDGFEVGKTFSVDLLYLVYDWLAVQVEVPIIVDPFNLALTVGAPMRWRLDDGVELFIGEDLLTIRITDFVPVVDDALHEAFNVAAAMTGSQVDDGDITIKGGVRYQASNQLALTAALGVVAKDFALENRPGWPLLVSAGYAATGSLDLGAHIGFMNLNEASETFSVRVGAALRL